MTLMYKQINLRSFASTSNLHSNSKPLAPFRNGLNGGGTGKSFINKQEKSMFQKACEIQQPEKISNSSPAIAVIQSLSSSISKQS